jgi:hypothetical protein
MFNEAHGMHDFINGCKSSADAAMNPHVRKVARLHALHELALLKELQSTPRCCHQQHFHKNMQNIRLNKTIGTGVGTGTS